MAKKKAVIKRGIFLTRNSKGIVVSIHSANGNKLASMSDYNNTKNAHKGILALYKALVCDSSTNWNATTGKYDTSFTVTDLTKPVKKTAKPTKK